MVKSNWPYLVLLLLIISCQKSFNTEIELREFLQDSDNHYRYSKNVNGVEFILEYKPTDILVKQELVGKDSKSVDSLRNKYGQYVYFNLSIAKNGHEVLNQFARDKNQFGEMVNQLAFGMADKIHLYSEKRDTIEMIDFVYPRLYGMSRSTSLMIVYPRNKVISETGNLNFVIEDLGLTTGDIKFKLHTSALENEPKLKF